MWMANSLHKSSKRILAPFFSRCPGRPLLHAVFLDCRRLLRINACRLPYLPGAMVDRPTHPRYPFATHPTTFVHSMVVPRLFGRLMETYANAFRVHNTL